MLNIAFEAHRSALKAHNPEAQTVFAALEVQPSGEVVRSRSSQVIILVIDTSGSMREYVDQERARAEVEAGDVAVEQTAADGETGWQTDLPISTKLDQAIEAAHALVDDERLTDDDRVAVVHFDDSADTLLPLTPLSRRAEAHEAIESLRDFSGGTHMAEGLQLALRELEDVQPEIAKRVFLFTDGKAFDEDECRPFAGGLAERNAPLVCLGIGTEYNEDLLVELADVSTGTPYHLRTLEQLEGIFSEQIGKSIREVVTNLQASVSAVKGVTLESVARVHPSVAEIEVAQHPYHLGNVAAGGPTIFLFRFSHAGLARPPSRARLLQLGLMGHAPGLGRREEFPVQELWIAFTTDEAETQRVDPDVMHWVQQKNADSLIEQAAEQAKTDPGAARQTLQLARNLTQQIGNADLTQMLDQATRELDGTGTISVETRKTIRVGAKTKTVPADSMGELGYTEEEIRKATGV